MPSISLLAAPLLLAVAAPLAWALARLRGGAGRVVAASACWLAVVVVSGLWFTVRSAQELGVAPLGAGIQLSLRLDAVSTLFALVILVPAATLLTFQRRDALEAGLAVLATAAAVLAVESAGTLLTALAWGTAATLVMTQLRREHPSGAQGYWWSAMAACLALAWSGDGLQLLGGTAIYSAVPVSALSAGVFTLLAFSALVGSGLLPWRTWLTAMWERPRLEAGSLALAIIFPIGLYVLVRAYALGGGHWPGSWPNLALAAVGAAIVVGAAVRGQAARSRRGYLAEVLPGTAGFALLALALGTPLGVAAGLSTVAAGALLTALAPLLTEDGPLTQHQDPARRLGALLALAVFAGLPPTLTFAVRLLDLQAAIEAGDVAGFLGLAAALGWLLGIAGAARALRLPLAREDAVGGGSTAAALVLSGLVLAAGAGLGFIEAGFADPATAEAINGGQGAVSGAPLSVVTAAGAWPALALALPLLLLVIAIGVGAYRASAILPPSKAASPPFFAVPLQGFPDRFLEWAAALRLPEEYRTLLDPRQLEAAMSSGRPILWLGVIVALIVAITR